MSALLSIEGLGLTVPGPGGSSERVPILRDVSLEIAPGEAVGLVGESGSGKSMTAKSVLRMTPPGGQLSGRIRFDGRDVLAFSSAELRRHRTRDVGLIYQDARAYINPVRRIGDFVTEALRTNLGVSAEQANRRAVELLDAMRISDPERRMRQYPHQLSGGMLQRVMIAAVLAAEPRLVIADEPTTALDVTTQSEVMAILDEQRRERGMALLFITHDLDLAAAVCDRIGVMYAGSLMETRPADGLHDQPAHPYTRALLDARPSVDAVGARLAAIPGRPIALSESEPGCPFAPRCRFATDRCRGPEPPAMQRVGASLTRCVRAAELAAELAAPGAVARGAGVGGSDD